MATHILSRKRGLALEVRRSLALARRRRPAVALVPSSPIATEPTPVDPATVSPVPAGPLPQDDPKQAEALPEMRLQKVQEIRQALASGRYDLDARLNQLFECLPAELASLAGDGR